MKFLIPILFAASFPACGFDDVSDEGVPPDSEFGYVDGKADSVNIVEGSEEAEAVLAFTNQPIADDNEGDLFLQLLDSELHLRAAQNIVEYRSGADGTFGTADDQTFPDLRTLDGVRFVGRVAIMELFGLAEAAGYWNPPASASCGDFFELNSRGYYQILSLEDLRKLETSGCSSFDGGLTVSVSGVYPSNSRGALSQIVSVDGKLIVNGAASFSSLHTVEGDLQLSRKGGGFPLLTKVRNIKISHSDYVHGFDSLEKMGRLEIEGATTVRGFAQLTEVLRINIHAHIVTAFAALETVARIDLFGSSSADIEYEFASLKQVDLLTISMNTNRAVDGTISFPSLEHGGVFHLTNVSTGYQGFQFPELETLTALSVRDSKNVRLPKLRTVNSAVTLNGIKGSGYDWGFPNLTTVGGDFYISSTSDTIDDLSSLKTVSGELKIWGGCRHYGDLYPFPSLENVGSIDIRQDVVCDVSGFQNVRDIPGALTLREPGRSPFEVSYSHAFENLETVGTLYMYMEEDSDVLPSLEHVDGSFTVYTEAYRLDGFAALERVEGDFKLDGWLQGIRGLRAVTGIGGDIELNRGIDNSSRDRFLNQLVNFNGSVTFD